MSNFLDHLIARSLNSAEVVRPRLPSLFEPQRIASDTAAVLPLVSANAEESPGEDAFEFPGGALRSARQPGEPVPIPPNHKNPPEQSKGINERLASNAEQNRDQSATVLVEATETLSHLTARGPEATARQKPGVQPKVSNVIASEGRQPPAALQSLLPGAYSIPPEQAHGSQADRAGEDRLDNTIGRSQDGPAPLALPLETNQSRLRPAVLKSANITFGAASGRKATEAASLLPVSDNSPETLVSPAAARVSAQESQPTIRITIGRVEVRAIMPAQPAPRAAAAPKQPVLSLDDYLKQRSGGRQ